MSILLYYYVSYNTVRMKDIESEAEDVRHKINNYFDKNATTGSSMPKQDGITDAALNVTGTVGAAVGGISRTAGGVVGAAGRGVGGTINNTTGTTALGNALSSITNGLEDGVNNVARGIEEGSRGKKVW